ncbi:MAG: alpha-D-ribose 1-methylphosphonate 5-triphosphate diphosphatase [Gemmobacter sp.]|uniref:alpha-D-ribose 1-methylphosphonate 5-triphosphate diphosphatase n=1 Tax=Gemmobacter sp. TaxID=1898957 RepID=UPI00391DBC9E
MPHLSPLRLTGARVLTCGQLVETPLTLADGVVADGPAREIDLSGYLVLPGIVDLHGDGFERHLAPRPTAPFDKRRALASAAAELAVNGVTTAWFAQSWSWEGGHRSGAATRDLLAALDAVRSSLLPDVRVQIRLETHVTADHPEVLATVARHGVDYVVFNNHLPEALDMARSAPVRFAQWAAQSGRSAEEMLAVVHAAEAVGPAVPAALARIAALLAACGVRLGSHDDNSGETRAFFRRIGAPICEFPTNEVAAMAARSAREPVLMGAPNVVRGGSQSGNIAAQTLIAAGLCDVLVSDYYYPALRQAAWTLVDAGLADLPAAWAMISTRPAEVAGLADRGRLMPGQRADLVVMNPTTREVEMTLCAGRVAHLSGEMARRMMGGGALQAAAE